jgi:hypothetical protein
VIEPVPEWLPPAVSVNPWHDGTYDLLYEIFRCDILQSNLTYRGFNVWFYPTTDDGGREEIFWHLTTRGKHDARLPDLRRCELLSWVKPLILRCPCPAGDVWDWDHEEGDGAIKTYVWLRHHDFVIIMKKLRNGKRRLITSYHLDNNHERQRMLKNWNRRLQK